MMQGWKRFVAVVAALAMVLSVLPVQWQGQVARAAGATGTVTADGVFVRKQPDTDANYWFKLDKGFECEVLDVSTSKGVTWYKVNTTHPDPDKNNKYIGYIHGDYFALAEDDAATEEETPSTGDAAGDPADDATTGGVTGDGATGDTTTGGVTGDGAADEDAGGAAEEEDSSAGGDEIVVGEVNADLVNFRKTEDGALIEKLNRGTRVEILSTPAVIDSSHWYKVRYEGQDGYIQAPFVTVLGTTSSDVNDYGYARLILSSANLRVAPAGKIAAQWETPGETLPVTGPAQAKGGYTWYPVLYKGSYYFVRNDCVQLVSGITSSGGSSSGSTGDTSAVVAKGYLITIKKGVNLRLQPGGDVIEQIDKNTVVARLSDAVSADGYKWYLVQVNGIRGYMRSDCVAHCDENGKETTAPSETSAPTETNAPDTTVIYGYVATTKDSVNLRAKPAGSSQEQIDKGVILPLIGYPVTSGKYDWYPVKAASGKTGYLRSDCVRVCTSDGTDTELPTTTVPGTTVTDAPTTSAYGYVMIKSSGVNVRKKPGGTSLGRVDKNTVWPMTAESTTEGGYTWYPINANGLKGYVRGDHSFKLSATQEQSYLAGNGVPTEDSSTTVVTTQYVQTIADKVYLRASASKDAEAPYQVALGTVLAFNTSQKVGGVQWYRVIYDNTEVWIHGDYVKVMTKEEYDAYLATNPSNTPQTQVIEGYIKTTESDVNVRKTAGGSVLGRVGKGLVFAYTSTATAKGYTWYCVDTTYGVGYLRGDCIEFCDKNGDTLIVNPGTNGSNTSGQEASYSTLKLGSKGTAVTNLVTELQIQGYYTGTITNSYTSAVETAVKKFQTANGLKVDGIAGSETQHKLFGTVPIGQGNSSDLTMTIYPAEKIDWFTGGIQELWPKGANFKIYDVKTGIVWWAHRWSGGYHADIEPLTAADTARLCKIYGVDDAQDIYDKNLWERRPCLVTIGSRTFACSLDGMPHNPDGDTIDDNNMTGQICLHFTNSKGHDSGKVSSSHAEAIEYAWKNAPNGRK